MHTYTGSSRAQALICLPMFPPVFLKAAFQKAGHSTYEKFLRAYMCAHVHTYLHALASITLSLLRSLSPGSRAVRFHFCNGEMFYCCEITQRDLSALASCQGP